MHLSSSYTPVSACDGKHSTNTNTKPKQSKAKANSPPPKKKRLKTTTRRYSRRRIEIPSIHMLIQFTDFFFSLPFKNYFLSTWKTERLLAAHTNRCGNTICTIRPSPITKPNTVRGAQQASKLPTQPNTSPENDTHLKVSSEKLLQTRHDNRLQFQELVPSVVRSGLTVQCGSTNTHQACNLSHFPVLVTRVVVRVKTRFLSKVHTEAAR